MTDLIAVIVATYNRPDALDVVLHSLAQQTDADFEVLVADDGSRPDTAAIVAKWNGRVGRRLVHVWHADQGFRLAEIRNRAILAAIGGYCVFLDGDCLAPANFIAAHRALAESGWFVTGDRILVSRALTERIVSGKLTIDRWSLKHWLAARARGDINRAARLVSLRLGPLRKLRPRAWQGARGANIAVWRSDLVRVNGFDGNFNGWGREDSDLFVRLIRAGVQRKDGRWSTGVLHLWHPEADRAPLPDNERRLDELLAGDRVLALRGLSALAEEQQAPHRAQ